MPTPRRELRERPIGVFDSGFGGLTVLRALMDLLPGEDLVYLGDTGRYPYGPRPLDQVRCFARQITGHLVEEFGVKLVVVACNTAAAAALDELRARFSVPIIGVIEPGVTAALRATRNGSVGVIGTVGTISSGAYPRAVAEAGVAPATGAPADLVAAACPGFVEFVERGEVDSDQVHVLAERLLSPLVSADVDTLLLGCTHYPYLARTIGDVMGRDVVLVSSADETAFAVRDHLVATGMARAVGTGDGAKIRAGSLRFLSSGDREWFRSIGQMLFGPELTEVDAVEWGDDLCSDEVAELL
ncbi:MAG: glutamate racemase [Actinomycetota bacterium]|nr:glutamate racemase [Actinomycetota bacterium]